MHDLLLIGESFSPWTKKARWALEYCELAYEYQEYVPTLSEPSLRWKLKQWAGSVSVPVVFSEDQVVRGSRHIAEFANRVVGDERLGDFATIRAWDERSEAALAEGRTRVVRCIGDNPQALVESLPSFIPNALRPMMKFLARDAIQRLDRKYADLVVPGALHSALSATQEVLNSVQGDYLLGEFSYADITMAVVVEMIAPIAQVEPPLGPATTQCWQDKELAEEFSDLIAWRDRLAFASQTTFSQFVCD